MSISKKQKTSNQGLSLNGHEVLVVFEPVIAAMREMVFLQRTLDIFLQPDTRLLLEDLHGSTGPRFKKLNESIAQLIDDWSMISYTPLDYSDEDSIAYLLSQVSALSIQHPLL